MPHHRFCCAAEDESRDARSSVRADHNEIGFPFTRRRENLVRRFPFAQELPGRWQAGPLPRRCEKRLTLTSQRREPFGGRNAAVRLKREPRTSVSETVGLRCVYLAPDFSRTGSSPFVTDNRAAAVGSLRSTDVSSQSIFPLSLRTTMVS